MCGNCSGYMRWINQDMKGWALIGVRSNHVRSLPFDFRTLTNSFRGAVISWKNLHYIKGSCDHRSSAHRMVVVEYFKIKKLFRTIQVGWATWLEGLCLGLSGGKRKGNFQGFPAVLKGRQYCFFQSLGRNWAKSQRLLSSEFWPSVMLWFVFCSSK